MSDNQLIITRFDGTNEYPATEAELIKAIDDFATQRGRGDTYTAAVMRRFYDIGVGGIGFFDVSYTPELRYVVTK
jgi:hypothetical protein